MANPIEECPENRCDKGDTYWSTVQFCGQDRLWKDPPTAKVVMAFADVICYCNCAPGKIYCAVQNCVDNMVNVMNQCTIQQLTYKQFTTLDGIDPDPCVCPCPYRECNYCSDPDIKEYIEEQCKTDGWWPGYPIVMSAGGGQFCTCLCPDKTAQEMTAETPDGTAKTLSHFQANDLVLAAGRDLHWRPRRVKFVSRNEQFTPIPAVRISAGRHSVSLAADQLVMDADDKLSPAIALRQGLALRGAGGEALQIDDIEKNDIYAAPLTFLGLAETPPGDDLADCLLNINGFVVGDYGTQVFYTLDMLDKDLLAGPAA